MDYRKIRESNRNVQMQNAVTARQNPPQAGAGGNAGRDLQQKFASGILSGFQPGNIGDINRVIWPFAFQFNQGNQQNIDLVPGQSATFSFSVTQEAAFLVRQISHATFRLVGGNYEYIDPFYFDEGTNAPNGLTYSLENASSTRNFNGPVPKELSLLGNANYPSIYPSTMFLLPNQTMLLNLTNNSAIETFRPFVTVWGYRIRLEDAQRILSTVSG